jgi:hypothetical protein
VALSSSALTTYNRMPSFQLLQLDVRLVNQLSTCDGQVLTCCGHDEANQRASTATVKFAIAWISGG